MYQVINNSTFCKREAPINWQSDWQSQSANQASDSDSQPVPQPGLHFANYMYQQNKRKAPTWYIRHKCNCARQGPGKGQAIRHKGQALAIISSYVSTKERPPIPILANTQGAAKNSIIQIQNRLNSNITDLQSKAWTVNTPKQCKLKYYSPNSKVSK